MYLTGITSAVKEGQEDLLPVGQGGVLLTRCKWAKGKEEGGLMRVFTYLQYWRTGNNINAY